MWITEGDLVKGEFGFEKGEQCLGIVLRAHLAWPGDDRDDTMTVKVLGPDGTITEWYDWQLQVVNEAW